MIENVFGIGISTAAVLIALIVGVTMYNLNRDDDRAKIQNTIVQICGQKPDPVACANQLKEISK